MSTARPQPESREPETREMDSLADLEERVLRTVELFAVLRTERDQARAERDSAFAELAEARGPTPPEGSEAAAGRAPA